MRILTPPKARSSLVRHPWLGHPLTSVSMAFPLVITTETILSTSIEIDPYITTAGGAIISIHGAIIGAAVIVITTDGYRLDSMNSANGGRFPPSIAHSNHRCFDGGHCGRAISSRQDEAEAPRRSYSLF